MSSPIGHALVGLGLARSVSRLSGVRETPILWAGAIAMSNLPDLDLLLMSVGVPMEKVHRKWSHSALLLGSAALLGLAGWERLLKRKRPLQTTAWVAALLSHPLLDALTTPKGSTFGIPLAWPLSDRLWSVERPIYLSPRMDVYLHLSSSWRTLLPELGVLGPVAVGLAALAELGRARHEVGRELRPRLLQASVPFRQYRPGLVSAPATDSTGGRM